MAKQVKAWAIMLDVLSSMSGNHMVESLSGGSLSGLGLVMEHVKGGIQP